jgi:putative ABC transport system permease protein
VETVLRDLRYAFRQLSRSPGFAGIAIVTLALAIGSNTAVFSVVKGVMLRSLPYDDPGSLVVAWPDALPDQGASDSAHGTSVKTK